MTNDGILRNAVCRIKSLALLRTPNYELPADSFIEQAVTDVLKMVEWPEETWYEPSEHGPDAWRRPTAEAYARVCVLYRKAQEELKALTSYEEEDLSNAMECAREEGVCSTKSWPVCGHDQTLAAWGRVKSRLLEEAKKELSITRQAAEGLQPATDIYYIGLFQEQMRLRKAAESKLVELSYWCDKEAHALKQTAKGMGDERTAGKVYAYQTLARALAHPESVPLEDAKKKDAAVERCREALRGIFDEHIRIERRNAASGDRGLPQGPCICIHCEAFRSTINLK